MDLGITRVVDDVVLDDHRPVAADVIDRVVQILVGRLTAPRHALPDASIADIVNDVVSHHPTRTSSLDEDPLALVGGKVGEQAIVDIVNRVVFDPAVPRPHVAPDPGPRIIGPAGVAYAATVCGLEIVDRVAT